MDNKEYTPKCTCGKQVSGICNGQGDCPKIKSSGLSFKTLQMEQKELPQEVVNEIKGRISRVIQHTSALQRPFREYELKGYYNAGAQIAHSHYLKELQAKDTTIKEQAEKIAELSNKLEAATENHGDALVKIEKLTGLLLGLITGNHGDEEAEYIWNNYKEQHGI